MLTTALTFVIRQILTLGGLALAGAGVITATSDIGYYCFDSAHVAAVAANALAFIVAGTASTGIGLVMRSRVKKKSD